MKKLIIGFGLILSLVNCITTRSLDKPVFTNRAEQPWVDLPKEIKRGPADCAPFASMINNRFLGLAPSGVILQSEWDAMKVALRTTNAGTDTKLLADYYKGKGYSYAYLNPKTCGDYSKVIEAMDSGCVGFRYMDIIGTGRAHIEAIIDGFAFAESCFFLTNSWGNKAKTSGFDKKDFNHTNLKDYNGDGIGVVDILMCPK